jgi:hypothetical protein
MLGLPIAFAAPAILAGLLVLPIIWWLLRLTPPRPREEVFPPLSILAGILKKEETPARSPWWLTLLRLAIAGLVVLALADPVLNPREGAVATSGPLVLIVDNGWATAPSWPARIAKAESLIDDAERAELPVVLVLTADPDHDATPGTAAMARERLRAAGPRPLRTDRQAALDAALAGLDDTSAGTLALLSDGLAGVAPDGEAEQLAGIAASDLLLVTGDSSDVVVLNNAENTADGFQIGAARLESAAPARHRLTALDTRGRAIAEGTVDFAAGQPSATAAIAAPFELRNEFARIVIEDTASAGATYLLDDSFRRRRVALLSGETADLAQPLLSPLYYIERALAPYADLIAPQEQELAPAIAEILAQRPSVIAMADIGTLPEDIEEPLQQWIDNGGTLIRFAGPRLAGAAGDDPLIPVSLRQGERALGGALSWTEPQPLADYPDGSPFFGLQRSQEITVTRQVLAEPEADLAAKTWASLADGTPLVTAEERGAGRVVLFHVTAEATWSNLPISGDFVEMLRRTVQLARSTGVDAGADATATTAALPPYRLLDAYGVLTQPSGEARPLQVSAGQTMQASAINPPGLYGTEDGFTALNLMDENDALTPLSLTEAALPITRESFAADPARSLRPILFALAFILLLIDGIIVLVLAGALTRFRPRLSAKAASSAASALLLMAIVAPLAVSTAHAADPRPGDEALIGEVNETHLAYVMTGEADVDRTSERGLAGLSQFLTFRTSLEPGTPTGVDIETDPLAFYPLIYWPISASAPMPSAQAIGRIDAYMKNGGTVLFDTRDQFADLGSGTSPENQRLRAILSGLDIPALEPVPEDHVIAKAFYLLEEFPGRYSGSAMWVEALAEGGAGRSAVSADGVTSIIITGNDLAGAWAVDQNLVPLFPTVPADPMQREYAYRTGVNIMMYMLTGNYKTDQVHVPALLERLGQ